MARGKSSPLVALAAVAVAFGFMVFIARSPELRDNPFYQGMTGVVLVAAVAIALFSAVPSSMTLKGGAAVIGGAAALFVYTLEPIKGFLFRTRTVTGTVYFMNSRRPVPGVLVRNPKTMQYAEPTNAQGDFTLSQVSTDVKTLAANYAGEEYTLTLNEEDKYPVIKPPLVPEPTPKQRIEAGEWEVTDEHQCPAGDGLARRDVKLYVLQKTLPAAEGYPKLYVQVSAPEGAEIVHAEKISPPVGTGGEVAAGDTEEAASRARKWWLPANGREVPTELAVCLRTPAGRRGPPPALETFYWFEKEVEEK